MNLFVSYASERRDLAERLAIALRDEGHDVFFDAADLPAGEAYHKAIRDRIRAADVFVFLVSSESIAPGAYALTELEFAKQKWKHPARHVLSAVIEPVPIESIPAFSRAVTLLEPTGDPVAEAVAAVAALGERAHGGLAGTLRAALAVLAMALAVALWLWLRPDASTEWRTPHPGSDTFEALLAALEDAGWQPRIEDFRVRPLSDREDEFQWLRGGEQLGFRVRRDDDGAPEIAELIPRAPPADATSEARSASEAESASPDAPSTSLDTVPAAPETVPGRPVGESVAAGTRVVPPSPWGDRVTLVPVENGFTIEGDLADGAPIDDLAWASRSEVACWVGTEDTNFRGHHVLFALAEPQPRDSNVSFSVEPDPGVDVSVYAYQIATTRFDVPPDLPGVLTCEAAFDAQTDSNPGATEAIRPMSAFNNPYNVLVGVAGAAGHTSGAFRLTVHVEDR